MHSYPTLAVSQTGAYRTGAVLRSLSVFRTATIGPRVGVSWLMTIYLVAGGIVAASHHYWSNLHTLKAVVSAILATLLWPLILVGINLHIH
jgi:hypothetical protein